MAAVNAYPLLLVLHLAGALAFVGAVFFEVVILDGARRHAPAAAMRLVESGIGRRARRVMPWVLLVLYGSGLGMAWHHRAALAHPLASSFAFLLTLKIVLALSVFGHFLAAMWWARTGRLFSLRSRRLHLSVFCHMAGIVLLAKAMWYLPLW